MTGLFVTRYFHRFIELNSHSPPTLISPYSVSVCDELQEPGLEAGRRSTPVDKSKLATRELIETDALRHVLRKLFSVSAAVVNAQVSV